MGFFLLLTNQDFIGFRQIGWDFLNLSDYRYSPLEDGRVMETIDVFFDIEKPLSSLT